MVYALQGFRQARFEFCLLERTCELSQNLSSGVSDVGSDSGQRERLFLLMIDFVRKVLVLQIDNEYCDDEMTGKTLHNQPINVSDVRS